MLKKRKNADKKKITHYKFHDYKLKNYKNNLI